MHISLRMEVNRRTEKIIYNRKAIATHQFLSLYMLLFIYLFINLSIINVSKLPHVSYVCIELLIK